MPLQRAAHLTKGTQTALVQQEAGYTRNANKGHLVDDNAQYVSLMQRHSFCHWRIRLDALLWR